MMHLFFQLQTAKHKIHSIFFVLSPAERMKYIAQSRLIKLEKKFKQAKEVTCYNIIAHVAPVTEKIELNGYLI